MSKISNNFLIGTVNKDLDERLVPMGQLTDAMNISIITSEEGQKGVVKNALGNVKKTDIANKFGISNPVTIHTAKSSSDGYIYNFICGDNYDAIIEYDSSNNNAATNTVRVLQSISGGALNFSKTNKIKASDIIVTSEGEGNFLAWTGDLNPPRIINIKRAKQYLLNDFTSTEISVIKPPPLNDPYFVMYQTIDPINGTYTEDAANFIKDKYISFAYRYKYNDGYYSAISSWTEYCFTPKSFSIDYSTLENKGMENLYNTVQVYFNTGDRDVIGIDLLFRESKSNTVYVIDKFNKEALGYADNSNRSFVFKENKIYSILPDAQYYRNYDNVPLLANAQTVIGNRLLYGDFTEGRNLESDLKYTVALNSTLFTNQSGNQLKSLHSNRDIEVAVIYMDGEGRKPATSVSKTNMVNIPPDYSNSINKISVTTISDPPSWAKKYKFAIKQIKGDYETIYSNVVIEDPTNVGYAWLLLEGENINKVKTGDDLIVKADKDGPVNGIRKTKALEVKEQVKDFLTSPIPGSTPIPSQSGLYLKIKPSGFNIQADVPIIVTASANYHNPPSVTLNLSTTNIPTGSIVSGTRIHMYIHSDEHSNGNAYEFDQYFSSNDPHATFKEWFDVVFSSGSAWGSFLDNITYTWTGDSLKIQSKDGGYGWSGTRYLIATFTISKSPNTIFETIPIDNNSALFFEAPTTYSVVNGLHHSGNSLNQNLHDLNDVWDCVSWGNGAESYKIMDKFNSKKLAIDFNPTAIAQDEYGQINRFADLTYGEGLQESTNVNRLNEFNLYLANYKDDMQKSFGKIVSIKGFDTNIDVIQENKYSVVYYGKDLLYNADGSTNLQKIPEVLGQQKAIDGEFGSQHPGAFDFYGFNRFFPDVKRCVIMQKSNEGLVPISNYGMNFYFTRLFADNKVDDVIAAYDLYLNVYILNVKYTDKDSVKKYVTWLYSDESNGWVTKQSFDPEDMTRLNGGFYSFYLGEIYKHNESQNYNTFYGTQTASSFSFNMNVEPGTRKVFRTLSTEGTDSWKAKAITDQQTGHIDITDYQIKEGVSYAYIRGDEDSSIQHVDTATPSVQGIGTVYSINGNNVTINGYISNMVSVGDKVFKANGTLIGNITAILSNGITLSSVAGLAIVDFIYSTKPQSVETSGLLGYYMNVTLELDKNTKSELYQVNSEVSKSFM